VFLTDTDMRALPGMLEAISSLRQKTAAIGRLWLGVSYSITRGARFVFQLVTL
jgi:hypothetical protein